MENVCEQFIAEASSIFEYLFAVMCPKLAETSVSEQSRLSKIEQQHLMKSLPGRAAAGSPGKTVSATATVPSQ